MSDFDTLSTPDLGGDSSPMFPPIPGMKPDALKPLERSASNAKTMRELAAGREKNLTLQQADLARREEAARDKADTRMTGLQGDLKVAENDLATTPHPEPVPLPDPHIGEVVDKKNLSSAVFAIIGMSLIGAKGGRGNWKMAAAGIDGALKGYKEGSIVKYKEHLDTYKREYDQAIEKERESIKKYNDILKSKEYSINQKMRLIQLAGGRGRARRVALQRRAQELREGRDRHREVVQQREHSRFQSDADLHSHGRGRREVGGEKVLRQGEGSGQVSARRWPAHARSRDHRRRDARHSGMGKDREGQSAVPQGHGRWQGQERSGDAASRRDCGKAEHDACGDHRPAADWKANASSLAFQTKKLDAIEGTLNAFHNNLDTWNSLAQGVAPKLGGERVAAAAKEFQKIDFIGVKALDDVKLRIESQFNDPTVAAYMVAAMAAAMDYARIMQGPQSIASLTEDLARTLSVW
jgi:hypothetical protein